LEAEKGIAKTGSEGWNRPLDNATIKTEIKPGAVTGEDDDG
jgi:hypothetical protein